MTTDDQPQNHAAAAAARAAPIVLLVVAASALVAIGSSGTGLLLPAADLNERGLWAVRMAAAVAVAAGAAGLLVQRRHLLSAADRRYDPAVAALVTAASIMGVLALLSLLAPGSVAQSEAGQQMVAAERAPSSADGGEASGSARPPSGISGGFGIGVAGGRSDGGAAARGGDESPEGDPRFAWTRLGRLAAIFILIVLIALAMISLRILGRGGVPPQEPPGRPPVAAADAEAGLEASLDALSLDEQDPRGGITAAYRTLLGALADAGAPREPQEAPYEHLFRTLAPLSVDPAPMHRLAELYVVAQFSTHPVTAEHRDAAAAALALALRSIRAAHPTGASDREMTDA